MSSDSPIMFEEEEEEIVAEKPFEESEKLELSENVPNNRLESDYFEAEDMLEIDRHITKVGEMITREEIAFAELERKIHEMEAEGYSPSIEITSKSTEVLDEIVEPKLSFEDDNPDEDEGRYTTEQWVSDLVPKLRNTILQDYDISDEKSVSINETAILEAAEQAKEEMVLDEDNPMAKRFQVVLRDHLLRQIEKLKINILELEGECKKKEASLKNDAESAYNAQQMILRQRDNLRNYKNTIEQLAKQRNRITAEMKCQEQEFNELNKLYEERKHEVEQCSEEADMLTDLVKKMMEHDKEQEREITYSKKRQDINIKDKERLSKEKQAQDMLLWRLQKQSLEKRRETDDCLKRCKTKSQECQLVSSKLLQATVERAGLLMENQAISKELQKSFLHIKQLDSTLQNTKNELEKAKINWGKLKLSLKWYKKHLKILMEQNETLMEEKRKAKDDFEFFSDKIEIIKEKKYRAMEELNSFDELMKSAEKDLNDTIQSGLSLKADEENIFKQITNASYEKTTLQKAYIDKISSLERADKLVKNMNDLITKRVEEHKKQELKMYKLENDVSKLMVEMESMKSLRRDTELEAEMVTRKIAEDEDSLKKIEERLNLLKDNEFRIRNAVYEKKKELENLELAFKHKTYVDTPLLVKKNNFLQNIKKLQQSIDEKENLWMEMQEGCLRATIRRNKQLERVKFLKDQITMIESSLERSINQIKKEQQNLREIMSELKTVTHKMEVLHETELKQGQAVQKAEEVNKDREDLFIDLLKKLEITVTNVQKDIWDLEEGNQQKADVTDMLQKELLEWNKKYFMALEMKKEVETEKSKGGEIAAMKQEIHRMEVRYANLRKAEERLITDLELCLVRRDTIVDAAEAREKRAKSSAITARAQAWRRIEESRAKLRTIIREVREIKKEKEKVLETRRQLNSELIFWRNSVDSLSESLVQLEVQIQEGQIHRHKTLEMTVMRQRKTRLLEDLRMGRYRVSATEDSLAEQALSVQAIRNALQLILDELKNDFPTLKLQILQIDNTVSYNIDPEIEST